MPNDCHYPLHVDVSFQNRPPLMLQKRRRLLLDNLEHLCYIVLTKVL